MSSTSDEETVNDDWKMPVLEYCGRIAVTAIAHPFEYVKILIQIGHEPLPPEPARTIFGKRVLALTGAFGYMKHIKQVDGFFGLYRGIYPKLCANIVSGLTFTTCMERLPKTEDNKEEPEDEEELTEEQKVTRFVHKTVREMLSRCAAVLVSHPLHVITVRSMAQFVGREGHYSGVFSGLTEVFKDNGLKGFFAGLVPRLVGEVLTLWFAHVAAFVINTFIVEDKGLRSYVGASVLFVASTLTYPFTLVSNIMAVNNSSLVAGKPPAMPLYTDWTDCWSHLSAMGNLKRGSSTIFPRYYRGPLILDSQGRPSYAQKSSFRSPIKKQ